MSRRLTRKAFRSGSMRPVTHALVAVLLFSLVFTLSPCCELFAGVLASDTPPAASAHGHAAPADASQSSPQKQSEDCGHGLATADPSDDLTQALPGRWRLDAPAAVIIQRLAAVTQLVEFSSSQLPASYSRPSLPLFLLIQRLLI